MSSEIDNQSANINILSLPVSIGANNNTSPSLPPTRGSLAIDTSGGSSSTMYLGTGSSWVGITGAAGGAGDVIGPASSVTGDVAIFSDTTGKVIADSGILASGLVSGPASAVGTDIPIFSGATGKIIADSGNQIFNPGYLNNTTPVTFTATGGNPNISASILYSGIHNNAASATSNFLAILCSTPLIGPVTFPVSWSAPAATLTKVPSQQVYMPMYFQGTTNAFYFGALQIATNGAMTLIINANGAASDSNLYYFGGCAIYPSI